MTYYAAMSRLLGDVFPDMFPSIHWQVKWVLVGVICGAVVLKIVSKAVATFRNKAKTVDGFPGPKAHWLLGNLDTVSCQ